MAFATYKPSGKYKMSSLPLGLVIGGAVAFGGAYAYQWLVDLIPWIYLCLIVTVVFGALIGFATGLGLRSGHCRSASMAILIAMLTGLGGVAASYPVAREYHTERIVQVEGLNEAQQEEYRADFDKMPTQEFFALYANEIGFTFSRRGKDNDLEGGIVYALWVLEMLLIVGVACWAAKFMIREPYCEASGNWCEEETLGTITGVNAQALLAASKAKELGPMLNPQRQEGSPDSIKYTAFTSPSPEGRCYISGELSYKKDKEDKDEDIFEFASIRRDGIEAMKRQIAGTPAPEMPAAPDASTALDPENTMDSAEVEPTSAESTDPQQPPAL